MSLMQRFCEANSAHYSRNLILSGTFAHILCIRLFEGLPFSRRNAPMMNRIIKRVLSKFAEKQLLSSLIKSGRENDSIVDFQKAIDLGSLTSRAELALLCFNKKLQYSECKKAFELVKEGHRFGCSDCSGMLAHFYITGNRGIAIPCDETSYCLACASAAAGSWFGKMALAHFLKSLLGVQDPDEETFDVLWSDPFIRNFASPRKIEMADVADVANAADAAAFKHLSSEWKYSDIHAFKEWFDNSNIVFPFEQLKIAKRLIEEIKQEHSRNPDMPKVWNNLPAI